MINPNEQQYLNLLQELVDKAKNTEKRLDRTGVGTYSLFGRTLEFDLTESKIPLLTTKKTPYEKVLQELYWMFRLGNPDTSYLDENNNKIWREWSQYEFKYPDPQRKAGWVQNKPSLEYECYDIKEKGLPVGGFKTEEDKKLAGLWTHMMKRCYKKDHHNYKFYGAKGVFVCSRWHDVKNFVNDVKKLPNWASKRNNWNLYELDKDYYSSNCYSPSNCLWLHTAENNLYNDKPVEVIDNEGVSTIYLSLSDLENKLNIPASIVSRWIHKGLSSKCDYKYRKYFEYSFRYIEKEGYSYRLLFTGTIGPMYGQIIRGKLKDEVDQLKEAIDLLKRSPRSRRALFSSWGAKYAADERLTFKENVEQNKGVLNPCHSLMNQLYINDDNELEMLTFQRSCDIFLGFNWNAPFYATLAHLIARELGIKASRLVYHLGDVHLYSNHLEQAKLQLSRQPYQCPSIVIDKNIKRFDDWEDVKQISLINYQHHSFIKAPVAV